jgi:hypothetical protein
VKATGKAIGTQLFRNSSGNDGRQGRLIKTLGNLQDLRQRIYRKGKAEAVGWGGVDAGENQARKHHRLATSHKPSCEASRRAECGKSARSVRCGGGWKPATVRVVRHSQRKRGATDRPDLRVWRHSSTLPGQTVGHKISTVIGIYREHNGITNRGTTRRDLIHTGHKSALRAGEFRASWLLNIRLVQQTAIPWLKPE